MASGDGKKRRKKQSEQSPASGGGGADARPASGRVTSDSLLSVRKQIAYAKAFQAAKSRQVQPVYRTSFRKPAKKAQDDGGDGEAAQEQEEADGAGWRMPLLFVDGYNIIGRWPRLKKRQEKGDLAGARQLLLDDLLQFAPRRFEALASLTPSRRRRLHTFRRRRRRRRQRRRYLHHPPSTTAFATAARSCASSMRTGGAS